MKRNSLDLGHSIHCAFAMGGIAVPSLPNPNPRTLPEESSYKNRNSRDYSRLSFIANLFIGLPAATNYAFAGAVAKAFRRAFRRLL